MTEAERIRQALHAIAIQQGSGQWNLNQIRHILEETKERQ
jgi:hypothetical protein